MPWCFNERKYQNKCCLALVRASRALQSIGPRPVPGVDITRLALAFVVESVNRMLALRLFALIHLCRIHMHISRVCLYIAQKEFISHSCSAHMQVFDAMFSTTVCIRIPWVVCHYYCDRLSHLIAAFKKISCLI